MTDLGNGKIYTCKVNATNGQGTGPDSPASTAFVPSTVPGRPAPPHVSAGNALIYVSFTAPANGGSAITGYTAASASTNGGVLRTASGTRSPLTVRSVTNARTYHRHRRARNANGNGPVSAASANVVPADPVVVERLRQTHGFRMFSGDGHVYTFGNAANYGSAYGHATSVVGMATTRETTGATGWSRPTAASSARDAHLRLDGAMRSTRPIVGMAATPSGRGYWLVASDGGIFSFGDAHFYGSTGAIRLNRPIVGMAATPTGRGYWMVASDGGMFSFGDAHFYGSAAAAARGTTVVGMATTLSGHGY